MFMVKKKKSDVNSFLADSIGIKGSELVFSKHFRKKKHFTVVDKIT